MIKIKDTNNVKCIRPYVWCGLLVFDDPEHGLDKEPFVCGIPEILYRLLKAENINNYRKGFNLYFSDEKFDGYHLKAERMHEYEQGFWYSAMGLKGWLCPAMFQYFRYAPECISFKVENL